MDALDPKYHRLRGLIALALLQIGASGVINVAQTTALAVQQGTLAIESLAPLLSALPCLILGLIALWGRESRATLYLSCLACLSCFLFAAILVADQWSNGTNDQLAAHGHTKRFLYWFLAFACSVFAINHWSRAKRIASFDSSPSTTGEAPFPSEFSARAHALTGMIGLALIECRAENVIGFLYALPTLTESSRPLLLAASLAVGLFPMILGAYLLLGRISLLASATGGAVCALLLATNVNAYLALFGIQFASATDALIVRLNATGPLYWLMLTACAALLAAELWKSRFGAPFGMEAPAPTASPSRASSE